MVPKNSKQIARENEAKCISVSGMLQIHLVVLSQNLSCRFNTLMGSTLPPVWGFRKKVMLATADTTSWILGCYLFQFWLWPSTEQCRQPKLLQYLPKDTWEGSGEEGGTKTKQRLKETKAKTNQKNPTPNHKKTTHIATKVVQSRIRMSWKAEKLFPPC